MSRQYVLLGLCYLKTASRNALWTAFRSRSSGMFFTSRSNKEKFKRCLQCCGSMTFWGGSGSGSADPCLWLMDPDSDPDPESGSFYFRHWPSRCQQKTNFLTQFFLRMTFWSYIYIILQRKKFKKSHKIVGIKVFSYYFCMMIEGSGSGSRAGSGSIPLTSWSGSWRPKNTWIRWIRIRIRNTGCLTNSPLVYEPKCGVEWGSCGVSANEYSTL